MNNIYKFILKGNIVLIYIMNLNINLIECTFEEWRKNNLSSTFWIVKNKKLNTCITGYFDKYDSLNDKQVDHFLDFRNCYYIRGEPCCENSKNKDCYCNAIEERGECVIDSISIENNLENITFLRNQLLQNREAYCNYKNSNMNGINFG